MERVKKTIKKFLIPLEKFLILQFLLLTFKYVIQTSKTTIYPKLNDIFFPALLLVINKLKIVREDNSFANEFKLVEKFLNTIDQQVGYLVDIGASNGINQSSTLKLLINPITPLNVVVLSQERIALSNSIRT